MPVPINTRLLREALDRMRDARTALDAAHKAADREMSDVLVISRCLIDEIAQRQAERTANVGLLEALEDEGVRREAAEQEANRLRAKFAHVPASCPHRAYQNACDHFEPKVTS